jgi:hypothetical protein
MPTITNFGDVVTTGNAVVQGTGTSSFAGLVTFAQGFSTSADVTVSSTLNSTNVVATGNITGANLVSTFNVWAASNVNGANLYMTGNVWGGNLTSQYNVWAGSNVNTTNVRATGNITGANLVSTFNVWAGSNVNTINVSATGNITGANLVSTFNVWAGSNVNATNVAVTGNLWASNLTSGGFQSNTMNTVITSTLNLSKLLVNGATATTNQTLISTGSGADVTWGTIIGSQWTTSGSDIYYTTGKVAIGTSTVTYPLTVSGTGASAAAPYSNLAYQDGGWTQAYEPSTAATIKIYTDGKIGCTEVDVFSDRRIKTDICDSDPSMNLDTIRKLCVREFKYRDPIEHGSAIYTGLVAQEVKEVFPSAVSVHEGVIPDIFQVPISFSGGVCQFQNKIEGVTIGSSVKVLDENVEKIMKVIRISDFEIEFDSEIKGPKVFVYGQVVKDLHTVSYDRLVPILISAVQELAKKIGKDQ